MESHGDSEVVEEIASDLELRNEHYQAWIVRTLLRRVKAMIPFQMDENNYAPTPVLRFVARNKKKILQQMWVRVVFEVNSANFEFPGTAVPKWLTEDCVWKDVESASE